MYLSSSSHSEVNKARCAMFADGRSIRIIPWMQMLKSSILQFMVWVKFHEHDPEYPPHIKRLYITRVLTITALRYILCKPWRPKGFVQLEIIINCLY